MELRPQGTVIAGVTASSIDYKYPDIEVEIRESVVHQAVLVTKEECN
jgi:hypothetical protein